MPYPNLGLLQPCFDQYGNTYECNPMVQPRHLGGHGQRPIPVLGHAPRVGRLVVHAHLSAASPFPPAACFS